MSSWRRTIWAGRGPVNGFWARLSADRGCVERRGYAISSPMSLPNHFELLATDGAARTGRLTTPHGVVRTPAFMPVGTAGAMKGMHWREVRDAGADIVLGNTYHLMLRPGAERIATLGGLQRFTGWDGPMLTDSGGFQVMSLSELRKVTEQA